MRITLILSAIFAATACKPPATDDYTDRTGISDAGEFASTPIDSPDTANAVWAEGGRAGRIVYGEPGEAPMLALSCEVEGSRHEIQVTRFAKADPDAKALMAMIGNGHTARLPIDAVWNGRVWLWQGGYWPGSLDVLTGPRRVELTIPGAGSLILNPSPRPAQLIATCRKPESESPAPE